MEIFKLNNTAPIKKENLCAVCDKNCGELLECQGLCQSHFHPACVGLEASAAPTEFKCKECTSGTFHLYDYCDV